ncbi:hypothetical protein OOT46_20300 [Aquabacterium sp. A7-Y]|uniref:hypothetical protein n=1 Tax=Aquabacterium sp. A7-Y TaxID=1349605 RepID=UPI00223E35C2|nr:hypothetical protein [Aquabacterium sp. A7-Y]MCW7540179.1 hypothetical protein [Aquabacterium sp. A7-Y]
MTILRTYAPLFVPDIGAALPAFARLCPRGPLLRFTHGEFEAAMASGFLLLCGPPAALAAHREIRTIAIVSDLRAIQRDLLAAGARILFGPRRVTTGRHLAARLPAGEVVEYLQFGWSRMAAH